MNIIRGEGGLYDHLMGNVSHNLYFRDFRVIFLKFHNGTFGQELVGLHNIFHVWVSLG